MVTTILEDGLKYGDIVVIGEGEQTFLEICEGHDAEKIKGVAFRKNNIETMKVIKEGQQ